MGRDGKNGGSVSHDHCCRRNPDLRTEGEFVGQRYDHKQRSGQRESVADQENSERQRMSGIDRPAGEVSLGAVLPHSARRVDASLKRDGSYQRRHYEEYIPSVAHRVSAFVVLEMFEQLAPSLLGGGGGGVIDDSMRFSSIHF
ncbi:hypothetical protein Ancab_010085 [Ancistrocladus abbreviatus]